MPFRKVRFKGGVVFARCDGEGRLLAQDGRVEIRYKQGDARAYHAALRNLEPGPTAELLPDGSFPAGEAPPERGKTSTAGRSVRSSAPRASDSAASTPPGAVVVYADGACSGNPGPAGVGVVLIDGKHRRELSHFLGDATNNVAELSAILLAAEALAEETRPVRMFTDSQYAIGVLQKGWKAKANVELVARVRGALSRLPDVALRYVPGHAGVVLNERADTLAVQAVQERRSSGWVQVG